MKLTKSIAILAALMLVLAAPAFAAGSKDGGGSASEIKIGQVYASAHGNQCFTVATVAVAGDVIIDSYIDDFQFTDSTANVTVIPNSDKTFGKNFAAGKTLISKRVNNAYYSELMTSHAGATVQIAANYDAIQAYVKGKKISDVEKLSNASNAVDVVSGCTLVDTAGYLKAIVAAAKAAQANKANKFNGDTSKLTLKAGYGAAHGDQCFSMGAVLTDGKTVAASYLDEFQFTDTTANVTAVPNSDAAFGANYAAGKTLISKRVNNAYYSELMTSHAGATVQIAANYDAIQAYTAGKAISDIEKLSNASNAVDVVSGCTLADTAGYLKLLADVAKK